jgi:hypothetical protein
MTKNRIRPSSRTAEAEWIADRLAPFGSGVTAIVPDGFEAYVRVFHPATDRNNNQSIRWSDMAAKSGRTMHRLAQFHAINGPALTGVDPAVNGPENGNLSPHLLKALCAAVSVHTGTPESCYFCLWEGYGWCRDTGGQSIVFTPIGYSGPAEEPFGYTDSVPEFIRRAVASEWRVHLPGRDYLFFEGAIEGATDFGSYLTAEYFIPQSPNLFWPQDHAWCVASEIDLYCTLVGGSKVLAESLTANPALEAWRVFPEDPVTRDSDTINDKHPER